MLLEAAAGAWSSACSAKTRTFFFITNAPDNLWQLAPPNSSLWKHNWALFWKDSFLLELWSSRTVRPGTVLCFHIAASGRAAVWPAVWLHIWGIWGNKNWCFWASPADLIILDVRYSWESLESNEKTQRTCKGCSVLVSWANFSWASKFLNVVMWVALVFLCTDATDYRAVLSVDGFASLHQHHRLCL